MNYNYDELISNINESLQSEEIEKLNEKCNKLDKKVESLSNENIALKNRVEILENIIMKITDKLDLNITFSNLNSSLNDVNNEKNITGFSNITKSSKFSTKYSKGSNSTMISNDAFFGKICKTHQNNNRNDDEISENDQSKNNIKQDIAIKSLSDKIRINPTSISKYSSINKKITSISLENICEKQDNDMSWLYNIPKGISENSLLIRLKLERFETKIYDLSIDDILDFNKLVPKLCDSKNSKLESLEIAKKLSNNLDSIHDLSILLMKSYESNSLKGIKNVLVIIRDFSNDISKNKGIEINSKNKDRIGLLTGVLFEVWSKLYSEDKINCFALIIESNEEINSINVSYNNEKMLMLLDKI